MIFDPVQGAMTIGGKRLVSDASPKDVVSSGFVFDREINMKTGWVFRNTMKDVLDGHAVMPALGFKADQLKRVSVTFLEEDASGCSPLRERHRNFLTQQLGDPTQMSIGRVAYDYAWGQISAEEDVRSGTSYIIVTWR